MKLILTCEHASNVVPLEFTEHFSAAGQALESHRGYDPGAADLFQRFTPLAAWHCRYDYTRLLVEPNRSLHHRQLFSEFSRTLSSKDRDLLISGFYLPYRKEVEENIAAFIREGESVLHLSVHSFTPVLNGEVRSTDLGLLYDPSRKVEKKFAAGLRKVLLQLDPTLKTRLNYPYRGISDGFTTYLRKVFPQGYAGIELEVNQEFLAGNEIEERVKESLFKAIKRCMGPLGGVF